MIEADKCNIIAADCQVELDKAMPALMAAESALNVLTKKDMSEVKAYAKPPALVEMTLQAVMTVLKRPPNWAEAKLALGDSQFLDKLMNYNKDYLVSSSLSFISYFQCSMTSARMVACWALMSSSSILPSAAPVEPSSSLG